MARRPFASVLAAVLLVAGLASAGAAHASSRASATPAALPKCPGEQGVRCGSLSVPLDWSKPGGSRLTVRFQVYEHTDRSRAALEPIVGMEGGPGFSSIASGPSYLAMIGPLHSRHDLIVMDDRGTGSSGAIDCPGLQAYEDIAAPGNFPALVTACQRQLGGAANDYGTVAVGRDLAAVLASLHVHRVDVYGDSYGDYAAQVFTLSHPRLVRALVLDGAYNNGYNPFETEGAAALRRAWTTVCHRSAGCGRTPILSVLAAFDRRLQAHPVTGRSTLADGVVVSVDLTAEAFAQLVYDATYSATVFTDLPAALHAFAAGHPAALLRMAADDIEYNQSGTPGFFSIGDLEAVSCHDYPAAWNVTSTPAQRRAELQRHIAALPAGAFAPFSKSVYLRSYVEDELVYGCLGWTPPTVPDRPFPPGAVYPHTPVLVLDGEFDAATPLSDTARVVRAWPDSTFVEVANGKHVTAAGDQQRCTSVIVQHFLTTLRPGSTRCAALMPPVTVLADFPVSLSATPAAAGKTPVSGRRVAWAAAETVADALGQWSQLGWGAGGDPGVGLHAGKFTVSGGDQTPALLTLAGVQLVPGLSVSGRVSWNPGTQVVAGTVHVAGPGGSTGLLKIRWATGWATWHAPATVTGSYAGRTVKASLRAPWADRS